MLELLLALVFGIIATLGALLEWKKWHINKRLKNYYAGPNFPIIGYPAVFIGKNESEAFDILKKTFQNATHMPLRLWLGPVLTVGISDPEDIKTILNSEDCLDKPYMYRLFHVNMSLFVAPKETWKHDRKALNPSFSNAMMARFLPVFNEKATFFCEYLNQHFDECNNNFKDIIVGCVTNQVINTSFHPDCELTLAEAQNFNNLLLEGGYQFKQRALRPWLKWDFVYQFTKGYAIETRVIKEFCTILDGLTEKLCGILADKFKHGEDVLEMGKKNRTATFVEKCLQLKREGIFTDENIDDHLRLLFAASIETSSTDIFNIILLLAIHPKYQERVVEELRSIFDPSDTTVTFEKLAQMKLMDMVVKEALRLFTVAPIFARECSEDIPTRNGTIPKDTIVMFFTEHIHHDKKQWGANVEQFYPERFLPENIANVHPYSYLPFCGGTRNCIGMKYATINIKVYLAHILLRYKFTTDLKLEDIKFSAHLTSYVTNERPFQYQRRAL